MPKFLTALVAEKIEDNTNWYRGQWRLKEDLVYKSEYLNTNIVVPAGFITDLESCPRIPVVFTIFGAMADRAAVVHDYLYTADVCNRETADNILKEACLLSGLPLWRAYGIWLGVRIGGGTYYKGANDSYTRIN